LYFASSETPQSALGSDLSYFFGRVEPAEIASHREPVIALHAAGFRLRDGNGGHRAIGPAVLAYEAVGVGKNFVAGGGIERSAFGILDARIVIKRGFFSAASVVDALFAGKRVYVC